LPAQGVSERVLRDRDERGQRAQLIGTASVEEPQFTKHPNLAIIGRNGHSSSSGRATSPQEGGNRRSTPVRRTFDAARVPLNVVPYTRQFVAGRRWVPGWSSGSLARSRSQVRKGPCSLAARSDAASSRT